MGGIILKEKIRILIADDNFDFVSTIVNYLNNEEDFEIVATAKDGKEAFEKIMQTNPDVVLFYFAGHGCIVNRCDCLLLKDALELISDNEPKNRVRSIELDDLCKRFRALGNQINIFTALHISARRYFLY